MTSVNPVPSSGCTVGFPTIAAAAKGSRSGVALPPTSPYSQVGPGRRGGSPSGDLTAPPAIAPRGKGMEVLDQPPSTGRMRGEDSRSLVAPVADEGEFTSVLFATSSTLFLSLYTFLPKDVARGFAWGPLIPDRGLNSIPSRYLIDWGVCPKNSPEILTL